NASALVASSLISTPMNRTPGPEKFRASWARTGASSRHGVHHEPQKFMTTTEPRSAARVNRPPVSVVPATFGACGRDPGPYWVVPKLPDTKLLPLPTAVSCAVAPPLQAAAPR